MLLPSGRPKGLNSPFLLGLSDDFNSWKRLIAVDRQMKKRLVILQLNSAACALDQAAQNRGLFFGVGHNDLNISENLIWTWTKPGIRGGPKITLTRLRRFVAFPT